MAFGVESGKIPNSQIISSTAYHPRVAAVQGRLNGAASWSARVRNKNQWIQIDLGRDEVVTAIATQGRANANQWVTSYYVSYSLDGKVFFPHKIKGVVKASGNYRRYISRYNIYLTAKVVVVLQLKVKQGLFTKRIDRLKKFYATV